jgi:hypothetical protein
MVAAVVQHDDGCPRCRFRGQLEKYLVKAATGTEEEWHEAASSIMTMLAIASSAMATMRARWCDNRPVDVMDKGAAVAESLVTLLHALDELQGDLVGPGATSPDHW